MSDTTAFRHSIETGSVDMVEQLLLAHPEYANQRITWQLNQTNQSDPLHYVSDARFNGWLTNGREGEIAQLLLQHGAAVNGNDGAESPLIGAASLSAVEVAEVLLAAGADVHRTAVHGATALHWAAWVGKPELVRSLLDHGAILEQKCTGFEATPLFWAVQAFSQHGPEIKADQLGAAKVLLEAGADPRRCNSEGASALDRSQASPSQAMQELLSRYCP